MTVEFIGIDPHTDRDHCPTVWADADAQELLLQGWKPDAATQTACESTSRHTDRCRAPKPSSGFRPG